MGWEGLLLIIDGLDEFTKNIPLEMSLLYLLLTRQTLHSSTIIVTTRSGAWTDSSSQYKLPVNRFYQVLGFSPENCIIIEPNQCKIKDLTSIDLFSSSSSSSSTSQHINRVRLYERECSTELLHQLANSVLSSEYIQYLCIHKLEDIDIILPFIVVTSSTIFVHTMNLVYCLWEHFSFSWFCYVFKKTKKEKCST